MISEDLKVHFTNKLNGDLIIANDINELKDKHNKGIDELVQIEQDVNVVRGDVQGVSCSYDDRNNYFVKDATQFSIAFFITGSLIAKEEDIYIAGYPGLDSAIYFGYNTGGIRYRQFNPNAIAIDNTRTNGFFVITFNAGTIKIYCNGVLVTTQQGFSNTQSIRRGISGWAGRGVYLSSKRFFNAELTATQIEQLYNQGRCDEVVLGDEWRTEDKSWIAINPVLEQGTTVANSEIITNGIKITYLSGASQLQYPRIRYNNLLGYNAIGKLVRVEFDYNVISGEPTIALFETIGFSNSSNFTNKNASLVGNGHMICDFDNSAAYNNNTFRVNLPPKVDNTPYEVEITNVRVSYRCLLNEYIPSFLTKTKWIDNGVSKQDIALTAPTFTYIKPYKQYSFGSGVPATPPYAAFTEYSDTATGNIWKCGTKPNTRQFAVSDWKQINN